MITLKELAGKEDLFASGHFLCPGCAISPILKIVLRATKSPVAVTNASGCLQLSSCRYPQTSWKVNWMHSGLDNAASTMSGITGMHRALKNQGKLGTDREMKFLVIAGDGATGDAGLSALSGAVERGENFVYLCLNNQLCAGTGGQRSSATPIGAATTTTPAGDMLPGKLHFAKDVSRIMWAHQIPYMAQTLPWLWQDLYKKAERAFETSGPAFINVLSPCPNQWKTPTEKTIQLTRLASDTCVWPAYEVKHGTKVTVNYKPKQKLHVNKWLTSQPRFSHLMMSENKWIVDKIQEEVDRQWNYLLSSQTETRDN